MHYFNLLSQHFYEVSPIVLILQVQRLKFRMLHYLVKGTVSEAFPADPRAQALNR